MFEKAKTAVNTAIAGAFQGQQGGGPIIAGVPESGRLKVYSDQLVIMVADNSDSMFGAKAQEASSSQRACLVELDDPANKDGFRVSLITYGSNSKVIHSACEALDVTPSLDGNGGGTYLAPALCLAQAEVAKYTPRPNRRSHPAIVLIFSDGQLGDAGQAQIEANHLKNQGVKIITIGFGADADEAQLRQLASAPDHYAFANVGQLKALFAAVGKTLSQQIRTI